MTASGRANRDGSVGAEIEDDPLAVLSDPLGREALYALAASEDGQIGVETVVKRVVDGDREGDSADEVRRELRQTQIPRLEEQGLLAYDCDQDAIRCLDRSLVVRLLWLLR